MVYCPMFFGPSRETIADGVSMGIHQAIQERTTTKYKIKISSMIKHGEHLRIPIIPETTMYEPGEETSTFETKYIEKDVNDIVYDVIEETYLHRFNPFTDVRTNEKTYEKNVGRFYQHEGWTKNGVEELIRFARENRFFPDANYIEFFMEPK